MNRLIQLKLDTLQEFQSIHPTAHVGGSIGLLIRGVDLKRNLSASDLDITIDSFTSNDVKTDQLDERSDNSDFDFAVQKTYENGYYTKIDIRVSPEPSFEVVRFNGDNYNVSKLSDILFWKKKYAEKGIKKHKDDLIAIETGIRPLEPISTYDDCVLDDDLPF